MDDYTDDSDVIIICKAMMAMIAYYSLRTMTVLIETELETLGTIPRLPLDPIFGGRSRVCPA